MNGSQMVKSATQLIKHLASQTSGKFSGFLGQLLDGIRMADARAFQGFEGMVAALHLHQLGQFQSFADRFDEAELGQGVTGALQEKLRYFDI